MPKTKHNHTRNPRLFTKAKILGYRRSAHHQNPNWSLLQLQGVHLRKDTDFYLGKRVAFIYKAEKKKSGTNTRVIWGRIGKAHGNSGIVRARFRSNLPCKTFGATARVMLYPSRV